MLLIHCNKDGLSSSWATSWKMSRVSQVTQQRAIWQVSNRLMRSTFMRLKRSSQRRDSLGPSLPRIAGTSALARHRSIPIEEGRVGLSTAGSLCCQDSKRLEQEGEAIRSCSGDARSDGCDIGRLPQVFLPKLERCALDTRTPH